MKHMLLRFCTIALAIYLSGCIEFEEQTMSYHFDEPSDSMRVFQDYELKELKMSDILKERR